MNHIDGFFAKFKSAFANAFVKKDAVATACLNKAKVEIKTNQIEIQGRVIKLNLNPAAKSAIFMKKSEILEELKGKFKPEPIDIR